MLDTFRYSRVRHYSTFLAGLMAIPAILDEPVLIPKLVEVVVAPFNVGILYQ